MTHVIPIYRQKGHISEFLKLSNQVIWLKNARVWSKDLWLQSLLPSVELYCFSNHYLKVLITKQSRTSTKSDNLQVSENFYETMFIWIEVFLIPVKASKSYIQIQSPFFFVCWYNVCRTRVQPRAWALLRCCLLCLEMRWVHVCTISQGGPDIFYLWVPSSWLTSCNMLLYSKTECLFPRDTWFSVMLG